MKSLTDLAAQARVHADNLKADIQNASTRIEHMRLTRLALEAEQLALDLKEASLGHQGHR